MALQRKAMTIVTAVALSAIIASGTFAWTSLNSQKINEWHGAGNPGVGPGGTLHDDHEINSDNKDVYVENWGSEELFVRVRLSEYMELGEGAGLKSAAADPNTGEPIHNPQNLAKSVIDGTEIDHLDTWRKYVPRDQYLAVYPGGLHYPLDYWQWEMGGQKYYYPVSPANREDKSYVDQGSKGIITADSINDGGIQAKQTRDAIVLSMYEWKYQGSLIGEYWVIDEDGWAYWASPLSPGDATGLLLNKVSKRLAPKEDYYYGINVEAQMATLNGDTVSGGLDNYERFGDDAQGGWTEDGQRLMEILVNSVNQEVKDIDEIYVFFGGFGFIVREYKIDFVNKKLWEFQTVPGGSGRDSSAVNEGYTFVGNLNDVKIADFFKECTKYGLANWERSYVEEDIMDGVQWGIEVKYTDSTVLLSGGSNKFPGTWNNIGDALLNLTGKNIF